MKEKHPIDSFFKEKLAERQYPMKEEYWSAAADLLEAQSGRKRKRFLWLFLLIGLLITGSTIGYYFSPNSAEQLEVDEELLSSFEAPAGEHIAEPALADREHERTEKKDAELKPVLSATNSAPIYSNNLENTSRLKKTGILSSADEKKVEAASKETSGHANRVLNALGLEEAELRVENADRGVELAQEEKEPIIDYTARVLNERAFQLADEKASNPSLRYQSRASRQKHQWGLDVGFAVNKGIKDPAASGQSLGMSPVLGISYRRRFHAKLELVSGLRYTQMPALTGDSTFLSTDFSFGAQVEGINIKALSLHQAEIPLQLAWYIGPRGKVVGGAYFRYLINVQSEVSRFESNPFESTPGPVNRAWGYKQGFNDLDYGLQLGYFYHLSEGLQIGLEAQYGLQDVRDNAFYRINSFDRNLSARIILRYHFLN